MGKNSRSASGIRIQDGHSGSYFWELKYLKLFDEVPDPGSGIFLTQEPESGMEKIRIRDEHPGSATLNGSALICTHFPSYILIPVSDSIQMMLKFNDNSSVVGTDPDPHRSTLILVGWAKKTQKKKK
jgi:hypothetical protein